jgi:glycosyltransferase involved in cell wall biosynthesis
MAIDVSVIIPVKDEVENVSILADEVSEAMANAAYAWECLWVDDGSTDDTVLELKKICGKSPHHRFISLDRNYGQSAAMATGFRHASGRIFVTLDGDGQNDPKDIPMLVNTLLNKKAHMVNGWRKNRADTLVRKISSRIGNGFRNKLTGDNIRDVGCSIRAFQRDCVENITVFKGMHRFLPTLARMGGASIILEVPVNHRPRQRGVTKYGISNRLWVGLADTLAVRWMQSRLVFPKVKNPENG